MDRIDREALVRTVQRCINFYDVRSGADRPLLRVNVFLTLLEVRKYQRPKSAGVASMMVPAGDFSPTNCHTTRAASHSPLSARLTQIAARLRLRISTNARTVNPTTSQFVTSYRRNALSGTNVRSPATAGSAKMTIAPTVSWSWCNRSPARPIT